MLNVKEYGAAGDGKTFDGDVIQKAINTFGEIYFPEGKYSVGTLLLKSNLRLVFGKGAHLVVVRDESKFTEAFKDADCRYDQNVNIYKTEAESKEYGVLYAFGCRNIVIEGGTISADDKSYCKAVKTDAIIRDESSIYAPGYFRMPEYTLIPDKTRPKLVYFQKCTNVKMSRTEFCNAPCFSAWFLNCENVEIDKVSVKNNYYQPNADGLHFSSCRNVRVTESNFHCGDDCIAIDCCYGKPSENVCVENCVFNTSIHAVRVYSGLDYEKVFADKNTYVRGVTIKNCTIEEACGALLINAYDGDISEVVFENISAKQSFPGTGICITACNGAISKVAMRNFEFCGNGGGYFYCENNGSISDLSFYNCIFNVTPVPKFWGNDFDGMISHCYSLPYNFIFKNVNNVTSENCKINFKQMDLSGYSENELQVLKNELGDKKFVEVMSPPLTAVIKSNCKNVQF